MALDDAGIIVGWFITVVSNDLNFFVFEIRNFDEIGPPFVLLLYLTHSHTAHSSVHDMAKFMMLSAGMAALSYLVKTAFLPEISAETIVDFATAHPEGAVPIFFASFAVGLLFHVPGVLFILAARSIWGPELGFLLSYLGALFSCQFAVTVVRLGVRTTIEGRLDETTIKLPLARRVFSKLNDSPVLTVAGLRSLMFCSPPLNYALGFTRLSLSSHFVGTAIGLVPIVGGIFFLGEGVWEGYRRLSSSERQ